MKTFARLPILVVLSNLVLIACSQPYNVPTTGKPVEDAYALSSSLSQVKILEKRSPIYQEQKIPVLYPPKVFACYVPSHVDKRSDILIGEHWVFFKLSESIWFIEKELEEVAFETKNMQQADTLIDLRLVLSDNFSKSFTPVMSDK